MPLSLPVPRTWSVGDIDTAAFMNGIRDGLNYLLNVPLVLATQTTIQSLTTGVSTLITLDTATIDTYAAFNTSTNTYTVPIAGTYLVAASVGYNTNATGVRSVWVEKNGSTTGIVYARLDAMAVSNSGTRPYMTTLVAFNAGDAVTVFGQQVSGGSLSTIGLTSSLSMAWMHV